MTAQSPTDDASSSNRINPTTYYAPGSVIEHRPVVSMDADGTCTLEVLSNEPCTSGFTTVEKVHPKDSRHSALWRIVARFPERIGAVYLHVMPQGIEAVSQDGENEWLFGGTRLEMGSRPAQLSHAKRLHVHEFAEIPSESFAKSEELEEVVFYNPDVRVEHRAFAECHKLRSVTFPHGGPQEGWAAETAFFDTPYDAECRGLAFVPDAVASSVLTGTWGQTFLRVLRAATEHMEHDSNAKYDYDYELCCDEPLIPCRQALYEGYRAGEAELVYLMAQCELWTRKLDLACDEAQFGSILKSYGDESVTVSELLRIAAEKGSVRAQLYIAWLTDIGPKQWLELVGGCEAYPDGLFAQDADESSRFLEQAQRESQPLNSLDIPDLVPVLCEALDRLDEAQSDADLEEDNANDFGCPGPNPSWRTLRERIDRLALTGCTMGATCCVDWACDAYYHIHREAAVIRTEKDAWSAWCRERGMLTDAYLGAAM